MGEPIALPVVSKFYCPKCKKELVDTTAANNTKGWIECDLCDKRTRDVISCRGCDFDLCRPCAKG